MLSSISSKVLPITFKSTIHLELIFCEWHSFSISIFIEKTILSSLLYIVIFAIMDSMFVSLQNSYVEVLTHNVTVFGEGAFES